MFCPTGVYITAAKGFYYYDDFLSGESFIMETHIKITSGLSVFIPSEEYYYATHIFSIGLVYNYYADYTDNWPKKRLKPLSFDLTMGVRLNRFVNTISFDPLKRESIIALGFLF